MRRVRYFLLFIFCLCLLAIPVCAQTSATDVSSIINVSADGRCQVSSTVRLHLDGPASSLTFALPKTASNVSVSGTSVRTYESPVDPNVVLVDLSSLNGISGDYQLMFSYSLPDVLRTERDATTKAYRLVMEVPLLSGFDYPVDSLNFSLTMPGEITGKPTFTSSYLQSGIESRISYVVGGALINGNTTTGLSDREKVALVMTVSEEMFPGKLVIERDGNPEIIPMSVFGALALLYWIFFMRTMPVFRQNRSLPIEGITAGDLGCRLTAAGVDLTMMVFTWAQYGYLRIRVDRKGRVILEKRMDMGNERSDFEIRVFKTLFRRSDLVDATGSKYAQLCRMVSDTISGVQEMYTKRAGNVKIFRILGCGISVFCGICFAALLGKVSILRTLLSILFVILGIFTAWGIQGGMYKIHVRGKIPLYVASICGLIWIILGIIAGQWIMGVVTVAAQYLIGLLAAYGGRRSELGMYNAGQILGLRSYLRKLDENTLMRLVDNNPDYFFDMLPYAIALGVDTKFAKAFGKMELPECHYLLVARNDKRTAADWALLVRKIADQMDKRQRRLELEKWFPINVRFY